MVQTNGAINLRKVDYRDITIFEDTDTPYVLINCDRSAEGLVVTGNIDCNECGCNRITYEIHIPKNSIINQININLK